MTTPTSRVHANSPLASANPQEAPRPADDRAASAFSALMRGADAPAPAAAQAADSAQPDLGEILRAAVGPMAGPTAQASHPMPGIELPASPSASAAPAGVLEARAVSEPGGCVARHSNMPEAAVADMPVRAQLAEPMAPGPAEVHGPLQEVRPQGDTSASGNLPDDPSLTPASADPATPVPATRSGADAAPTAVVPDAPSNAAAASAVPLSQAATAQKAATAAETSLAGATIESDAHPATLQREADAAFAAGEVVRQTEAAQAVDDTESLASADASAADEAVTQAHLEEDEDNALERPALPGTGPVSASVASAILAVAQQQQAAVITQRIHIEIVNRPDSLPLEVLKSI